jgi:hypothetical protein
MCLSEESLVTCTQNQALNPTRSQLNPVRFQPYLYRTVFNGPIILSSAPTQAIDISPPAFEQKLQAPQIFSGFNPVNLIPSTAMLRSEGPRPASR